MSIGLASARLDDTDISEVIERADQALYLAKESGRNRTVEFTSEILKIHTKDTAGA